MKSRLSVLSWGAVILLALATGPAESAGRAFSVAPPPAWALLDPLPPPRASGAGNGAAHLLLDDQVRVSARGVERFHRRIKQVTSTSGLEAESELKLEFEPSYQRLTLHHLRIHRDRETIDALRPREIKLIQPEADLRERLYNGTLTALIFVPGVRVGDIIDYAYSVDGDNPILGGRFADTFYLGDSFPVARLRCRLLWPAGRPLYLRNHNSDLKPVVRALGLETEYLWEQREVAGSEAEDFAPAWYEAEPSVDLSEFADWGAVVAWALPLYPLGAELSPALRTQIEEWSAATPQPGARLLAALRFVQDEVRYLGIEMGPYSHLPRLPSQVFAQRFGDCKDKSLLLAVILNRLGIEAWPALVNTFAQRKLDEWQPSPFAFDHVIVQARLDGRTWWLDPTIALERGDLAHRANPDFERALVIRPTSGALEEIPITIPARPMIETKSIYRVAEGRPSAELEVRTIYRGIDADDLRAQIASGTRAEFGRQQLSYQAEIDPAIEAVGLPQVSDDEALNTIETVEKYRLLDFWKSGTRRIVADRLSDVLDRPRGESRRTPVAIEHPLDIIQTIELQLPEADESELDSGTIIGEAWMLEYRTERDGKTTRFSYRLRSRTDQVEAAAAARHLALVDQIRGRITRRVMSPEARASGQARPLWTGIALGLILGLLSGAALVYGIGRARRPDRAPDAPPLASETPRIIFPGETPAQPLRALDEADLTLQLKASSCRCGATLALPDRPLEVTRLSFDGRRLCVVRLACRACGANHDLYFEPFTASQESPLGRAGEQEA
jgi:transglutaminase-like putative cysteine protease